VQLWCMWCDLGCRLVFFFQAEDGIRDPLVTGVQTCALPIFALGARRRRFESCRSDHSPAGTPCGELQRGGTAAWPACESTLEDVAATALRVASIYFHPHPSFLPSPPRTAPTSARICPSKNRNVVS